MSEIDDQPWLMTHHIRAVRDAGYIVTVPGSLAEQTAQIGITDDAVQAAGSEISIDDDRARRALEAALPMLACGPALDQVAVEQAIASLSGMAGQHRVDHLYDGTCPLCRGDIRAIADAVMRVAHPPGRALLDRNAVAQTLLDVWLSAAEAKTVDTPEGHCGRLADAVVNLARPMPTVADLDTWLSEHEKVYYGELGDRCACGWQPDSWESEDQFDEYYRDHRSAEVLALLNGAES